MIGRDSPLLIFAGLLLGCSGAIAPGDVGRETQLDASDDVANDDRVDGPLDAGTDGLATPDVCSARTDLGTCDGCTSGSLTCCYGDGVPFGIRACVGGSCAPIQCVARTVCFPGCEIR